jgi:predicted esterase
MIRWSVLGLTTAFLLAWSGCGSSTPNKGDTSTGTMSGTGGNGGTESTSSSSSSGAGGAGTSSSSSSSGTGGSGGSIPPSPAMQTARELGTTSATFGFFEYLPPGYNDGAPRPLLVFFHGIGENGNGTSDLQNVLHAGPPALIAAGKWDASRPWVVISPQWNGNNNCPSADFIHDVITYAMANYHIDPKRVDLTGLSCGAIGGWSYLGKYVDEQVSAAVLISGAGQGAFDAQGCKLTRTAIWAFHGDQDPTVPPGEDESVMPQLIACPQPRMDQVFTLYQGVGHDAWTQTYDLSAGHDIYAWMLANHKP